MAILSPEIIERNKCAAVVREQVRARDECRCTECGMSQDNHRKQFGTRLHVHRIIPGTQYTMENCVTLCQPCHGPKPHSKRHEPRRKQVATSFHDDVFARVLAQAKRRSLSISTYIRMVVTKQLERDEAETPPPHKPRRKKPD